MRTHDIKNEMNDDLVIILAKEGNHQAFRQLYEKHRERVFRIAYRYTKNHQDAEDVMQETFIRAFKNIKNFSATNNRSFVSWLNRIGINQSIELLRKNKRKEKYIEESIPELMTELQANKCSSENKTLINITLTKIKSAMNDLSPRQRVVFDMRHSQHLPIKEIASYLHCSQSSIKKHLFRAVAKLQKKLEIILEEK